MRNQKKGDEKTFDYHPKKNLFNPKNIYSFLQKKSMTNLLAIIQTLLHEKKRFFNHHSV